MLVTPDTSHLEMSLLNDDAKENMPNMSVTLDTSHLEMSLLNDDAEANMRTMVITLDTSHLEMSPVNSVAPEIATKCLFKKNQLISITAETSQDPIGPSRLLEQSADFCRHSLMAAWSSSFDFGFQPVVRYDYSGRTLGVRKRARILARVRMGVQGKS